MSSDPSLESLMRNSKKSPKQTNKVPNKGGRNTAALLDKRNFVQAATDGGCRQNKHVKFQSSAIPFSRSRERYQKEEKGEEKQSQISGLARQQEYLSGSPEMVMDA